MRSGHPSEVELTECSDGELEAPQLGRVEAHLQRCPLCSATVARLREVAAAAGRMGRASCPPQVRERARAVLAEPSLRMSCRQATGMMHERLDRRLSLLAAVPFELHLSGCGKCRVELTALSASARAVRGVQSVEAPARLRAEVMEAYRQRLPRIMGVPRWRPVAVAASAVLAIGFAVLMKPSVSPSLHRVAAHRAEQLGGPTDEPLTIAAAPVGDVGESPAPASGLVAVEAEPPPTHERSSPRPTIFRPKGPGPEVTLAKTEPSGAALPAALRALRAVARSAAPEWEVQRAMESAGERFATIGSEAMSESMLVSLPSAVEGDGLGKPGVGGEMPASGSGSAQPPHEGGGGQPNPSIAPAREGAAVSFRPLA